MKEKYFLYNLCYEDNSPFISFNESNEQKMDNCHLHNHYEMLFMELGHISVENNGKALDVRAPAVILHNYLSLHRAVTLEKGYRRWVVNFTDEALRQSTALYKYSSFFTYANMTVVNIDETFFPVLHELFEMYRRFPNDMNACNHLTALILYELYRYHNESNTVSVSCDISYICDLIKYITIHYDEELSLDFLSQKYFISRAKLVQDFKRSTGITVKGFVTKIRMNNALVMLHKGMSVLETSEKCGYNSESNFITTFTKTYGLSPKKFINAEKKFLEDNDKIFLENSTDFILGL